MNIAEITTYKEGGAYTHATELIKGMDANIIIITGNTTNSGYKKEDGYLYYHLPVRRIIWDVFFINYKNAYPTIIDLLEENKIELVHFHSPLYGFIYKLLQQKKYPLVMTVHYLLDIKTTKIISMLYQKCIKLITLYIAKRVDRILCVNEDYIPVFERWGIDPKKLIYIPNGVDTNKFSPGTSKMKRKFGDNKIILYFGRLHYQKNVDMLIESFPLIKKEVNNVKLIIIGMGTDFDKLKKMSEYDKDIIMTGYVPEEELIDYMRAADVAVFPSRGENASFTIMEAMACEIPVVASDTGNARQILGDGRGHIMNNYTKEEISASCISILKNEKKAKEMGIIARAYVEKNHSWGKISKQTEDVYRKIIDERRLR